MSIRAPVRSVLLCSFHAILLMICMVRRVFPQQRRCQKTTDPGCPVHVKSIGCRVIFSAMLLLRLSAESLPHSLVAIVDTVLTELLLKHLPKPISSKHESQTPSKMRIHLTRTRRSCTNPTHLNNNADHDTTREHPVLHRRIPSRRAGQTFAITTMQWRSAE